MQPSAQLIDFRLDTGVPLNVVGKVPFLSKLGVLFEKLVAVHERLLVVSNDLS